MTIGIATRGPGAGLAAWRALLAAELLGRGEIGGFCVFVWWGAAGRFQHATTQRGGTAGLDLSGDWADATLAGLISSGPDRPEPLTQFLPVDDGAGLVTGHRLPSSPLPDGRPVNSAALAAMMQGGFDPAGLQALLTAAPALDAGLICLGPTGPALIANAPRVASRDDLGSHLTDDGDGPVAAVLLNSIFAARLAGDTLAANLAAIAAEAMGADPAPLGLARLAAPLAVQPAGQEAVEIDATGRVVAIRSDDPAYFGPKPRITAVYSNMPVWQAGRRVGHAASEVFADLRGGVLWPGGSAVDQSFLYRRG